MTTNAMTTNAEPPVQEYLTAGAAAAFIGVHRDTVRRWADKGVLPSQRSAAGHRLFLPADLRKARSQRI